MGVTWSILVTWLVLVTWLDDFDRVVVVVVVVWVDDVSCLNLSTWTDEALPT